MRCNKHFNIKRLGLLRSLELLTGFGVALVALLGAMLMTVPTHAEQSTIDTVNVTLQTSCTISGTINTPHTATVVPGVYTQGIGQTTIKAICNDINGFSLYAAGFTDNTVGKTVLASETSSTYDIPTGTATSGTSNWAMKVNSVSGTTAPTIYGSFDDYHSVPSSYTKVAGYGGATDPTDGSSVTTTYALYTTPTQLTGTYSGQVRYVIVHPSTANGYTIVYNANGGTVSPASEVVPLGTSITLPTPTQSGYSFLGWYTAPTGGTKVGDAGDTYSPTENVVLHAQWEEVLGCPGQTYQYIMQDVASWKDSIASETQISVCDKRDDNVYTVAKLNDGKVWMTQNMRFTYGTNPVEISDGQGGTTSWTPSLATYTSTGTWEYSTTTPESYYGGDTTNGAYYNWSAAVASNDVSGLSGYDDTEINTSICPKGWKLPQNAQGAGSWYTLYNTSPYTSYSAMLSSPINLVLSGLYNGSFHYVGSQGYYSSNTGDGGIGTYRLYLDSPDVYPQDYDERHYGISVRCVSI